MPQYVFGAGDFFGVPLTDANGNAIANPTPIKIGAMQEMSLDISSDMKELYGQNQFALAIARGKGKVSGKYKGAQISGQALNSLFFGQTLTAGTQRSVYSDLTGAAIPATAPYTITPTPPSSGTWQTDLGVLNASGLPMTRVASAPTTGEYSVSAGEYTFAAADQGLTVFISYEYSATVASAKKIAVMNLPMGSVPSYKAYMQTSFQGKKALVVCYVAISSKLSMLSTKLDDFFVPEVDFACQADGSNRIIDIYTQE